MLTLQAREQHIRREKAASNICSNQAHCALTAGIYLTYMGSHGLTRVAENCLAKAHYLAEALCDIDGVSLRYDGPFFHEFCTRLPVPAAQVETALEKNGVLSGLPLPNGDMLWCCTEKAGKEALDGTVRIVREACIK